MGQVHDWAIVGAFLGRARRLPLFPSQDIKIMNKMFVVGAMALSFAACSAETAAPAKPAAGTPAAGTPVANKATAKLDLGQSI